MANTIGLPWYRTVTREQWRTLVAATLGWMLDAMDFMLYLAAITTLQEAFDFDTDVSGLITTITLLASAVGGMLFGVISDRFGRVRALMATVLIFSLCSLGTATAQDVIQLACWRALLGLGIGGEWAAGAVLVSETWPAEHRDKAMGIMQSGWAIGNLLALGLVALVLPTLGWRWLFVLGVLPVIVTVWIRRDVGEPAVWLEGRKTARSAASIVGEVFGRDLIGRTLTATLLMAFILFAYWGLFSWIPAYLATPLERGGAGMDLRRSLAWVVPVQLGAFAGYTSFGFIAGRLGRRVAFIGFLTVTALLVPVYGIMARDPLMLIAIGPFLGYFGHGYFSLFGSLLAEIFPTRVRATGQAFAYGLGRAASALAPFVVGTLAQSYGIGAALTLTSGFFLAGAAMILVMPRTTPRSLAE